MIENELDNGKAKLKIVVKVSLFKYRMKRRQLMKVEQQK